MNMPDIVDSIAATLLWDVFLMGVLTLMALIWSTMLLDRSGKTAWLGKWFLDSTSDGKSEKDYFRYAANSLVIILIIYFSGIISNTVSDSFVDIIP